MNPCLSVPLVIMLLVVVVHGAGKAPPSPAPASGQAGAAAPDDPGVSEYCETELFEATCQNDEVIFMERALYGRMRLGRCVKKDLGFIGCYTNVLGLANWKCSGRRTCRIRIPDPEFDTTRPCLQELKTYFEAAYMCVKVITVANDTCKVSPLHVTHRTGYIASLATQETGCGTARKPYMIQAQPGQRLNMTLYDFSGEHANAKASALCWRYAVIKEKSVARSTVVCSGRERVKHVYLSSNNTLEVSVVGDRQPDQHRYFLLKYEVVGCPDFKPPQSMWFRREPDGGATVGCGTSSQQWRLQCVGNTWVGKMGNCTHYELITDGRPEQAHHQMSVGTSMMIIFGIAIGIGVIVFLIGFVSFKRCRRAKARKGGPHMTIRSGYPVELELDESRRDKVKQTFADVTTTSCQPQGGVGYHSLKLNGNEYTHIWETPVQGQTQIKDFSEEDAESPTKERRLSQPELFFMRHAQCEHMDRKLEQDGTVPRMSRKAVPVIQAEDFAYDPPRYFLVNREVWASNVPPYPDGGDTCPVANLDSDLHSHIHPTPSVPHTHTQAPLCPTHQADLGAVRRSDFQTLRKC